MELPRTNHPQLIAVGERLERAFRDQFVDNPEVREAFDGLAFELDRANDRQAHAVEFSEVAT